MTRAALALAAGAWVVAAAVLYFGSISFSLGGLPVRSHSAIPALIAAALSTLAAFSRGLAGVRVALAWWWDTLERRAQIAALALALVATTIGINWGTFAAGGSDSYCYLNQAELFARGEVHDFEPFGADPAWPGTPGAFVPAGHSAVPSRAGAMVPICPAGYPAMLAAAKLAFGRTAMFWVTPLMGGLAVWLTFLLGRQLAGNPSGLLAALLLATSPIFIYQIVQPMNDIPATALWCAVLVLVGRVFSVGRVFRPGTVGRVFRPGSPGIIGLLTGAALTIRPNLLPLAAVVGLWTMWPLSAASLRRGIVFALAALPGALFVLWIQDAMYGSPFRSGYGDLSALFSASHVLPNLARYPRWVLDVHTPILVVALTAPLLIAGSKDPAYGSAGSEDPAYGSARRWTAAWLLAFAAAVFVCYLPYVVFNDWWYQRFVLPALPPLFVLTAAVATWWLMRVPPHWRMVVFAAVCAVIAIVYVDRAVRRDAFRLRDHEYRFRSAGEYVATLPANAAIITGHQTGSVRFYSGRSTAGWGDITPGRLNDAIEYLRARGRKPYLLFEAWEEPNFRARFPNDPLGALAWPPAVDIDRTVRIYDPDDHAKYMGGEFVPTERIVSKRAR